ncbi:DUF4160 domain-containing protein [Paracidovorax citrulli]|uniref:DUF4160 domain-containing protein n=1 Tax=Paracidovorax citrulli TaxID=80869 RepID=UPI0005FBC335|nr:DUF4160 domain-containing protein [Paracidovorax citrulli]
MPTLARLSNSIICMYPRDHLPPHVHVILSDGREALVAVADLAITADRIKRREIADALEWVVNNRAALTAKWKELNP